MIKKSALFIILILLMGFAQPNVERSFNKEKNLLEIKIEDTGAGFTIFDPKSTDFRSYLYKNEDVKISLSFKPAVIGQSTLMGIKNNFNFMKLFLFFPEQRKPNVEVYFDTFDTITKFGKSKVYGNDYPIEFDLVSYENNQLKGYIRGRITKITNFITDNQDPECVTDDMKGICFKYQKVDMPFEINFNIKLMNNE